MSEQAQWTAAKVDELLHSGLSPCQDVADAVNAALAAERVETERWKQNGVNLAAGRYNLEKQLSAEREKVKALVDALEWLDEFVVEPEYFPADGDRQWWQEKWKSIRALAKVKEGK